MQHHTLRSIGITVLAGFALAAVPDAGLKSALEGVKPEAILEHIKVLASDEFEGRGPGTPGEEKTIAYVTGQFRGMGLKPGNPDGTFLQAVPLTSFQAKQVAGSFQVGDKTIALSFPEDFVAVSRRMVPEVSVEDSDVVFVGYDVDPAVFAHAGDRTGSYSIGTLQ